MLFVNLRFTFDDRIIRNTMGQCCVENSFKYLAMKNIVLLMYIIVNYWLI